MLIKGGLITGLSGRSGAVVYAHGRGGTYSRDFVTPTNPDTARQQLIRGALTGANQEWRDYSSEERSIWDNYAKKVPKNNRFGEKRFATGRAHFIAWYLAFTGATGAEPVTFPTPTRLHSPAPPLLTFVSYTAQVDTTMDIFLQTRFTDPTDDAGALVKIVCYLSPPLAATRNFWKQEFPDFGSINRAAGAPGSVNLQMSSSAGWDAAGGERAFIKFRYIRDDGRLSAFVYDNNLTVT